MKVRWTALQTSIDLPCARATMSRRLWKLTPLVQYADKLRQWVVIPSCALMATSQVASACCSDAQEAIIKFKEACHAKVHMKGAVQTIWPIKYKTSVKLLMCDDYYMCDKFMEVLMERCQQWTNNTSHKDREYGIGVFLPPVLVEQKPDKLWISATVNDLRLIMEKVHKDHKSKRLHTYQKTIWWPLRTEMTGDDWRWTCVRYLPQEARMEYWCLGQWSESELDAVETLMKNALVGIMSEATAAARLPRSMK